MAFNQKGDSSLKYSVGLRDFISLLALWNVALIPLFDVLSRNAQFFVYRRLAQSDLVFFAFVLSFIIPAILLLPGWLLSRVNQKAGMFFFGLLSFLILMVIMAPGLNRHLLLSNSWMILLILISAVGVSIGYIRMRGIRSFCLFLWPAILIAPAVFLSHPSIGKLMKSAEYSVPKITVKTATPVVMVVFDELPTSTLLNSNGDIDFDCYPNLANLAGNSIWYKNAASVSDRTEESVPAMLTGRLPRAGTLPITLDHPRNLFNLLSNSYDLRISESLTNLNPDLLPHSESKGLPEKLIQSIQDVGWVILNMIVPPQYSQNLPSLTHGWGDFGDFRKHNIVEHRSGPDEIFKDFIQSIKKHKRPALYFLHVFLPHKPWYFFPDGTETPLSGEKGFLPHSEQWRNQDAAVPASYYRHQLQMRYADRLIGELITKLKSIQIYDECLLIVTSDHGMSFRPGGMSRAAKADNYPDIAYVPLFIKIPGAKSGSINNDNVQLIDLFPAIAEIVGFEVNWKIDGKNLLRKNNKREDVIRIYSSKEKTIRTFPAVGPNGAKTLEWRDAAGLSCNEPFAFGPAELKSLIGTPTPKQSQSSNWNVRITNENLYKNVSLGSNILPAYVTGTIATEEAGIFLAIGLNGIIRSVTQTFEFRKGHQTFETILTEDSFVNGRNKLEIFLVRGDKHLERIYPALDQ